MKKIILPLITVLLSGIAVNAQEFKNAGFEKGTTEGWNTWQKKEVKVIKDKKNVHSGTYAAQVNNGLWQGFNIKYTEGAKYKITAYTKYSWGEGPCLRVEYYNPESKKMENIKEVDIVKDRKAYKATVIEFEAKKNGYSYRFTAVPGKGKGGLFFIDDIKIEKIN